MTILLEHQPVMPTRFSFIFETTQLRNLIRFHMLHPIMRYMSENGGLNSEDDIIYTVMFVLPMYLHVNSNDISGDIHSVWEHIVEEHSNTIGNGFSPHTSEVHDNHLLWFFSVLLEHVIETILACNPGIIKHIPGRSLIKLNNISYLMVQLVYE